MIDVLDALKSSPLIRSIVAAGAALVVLGLLAAWQRLGPRVRAGATVLTAALTVASLAAATGLVLRQAMPPEWDFRALWLCGRAVATGENPYDPAAMRRMAAFARSADFERELIDVGCLYPPSSLGLFYPLGLLPLRPSYLAWMAVAALAALACVALIAGTLQRRTLFGITAAGALLAALGPTWQTLNTAQTNFLLLLLLLILLRGQPPVRAGVLLGFAMVVKPLAALLLLPAASVLAWRTVLAGAAVVVLASLGVLWATGPSVFSSYLFDNPSERLPDWVYTEDVNQSMLAVLVRAASHDRPTVTTMTLYAAIALTLVVVTAWLCWRVPDEDGSLRLALAVPFALAVYPGTLPHYSLLLLVPFLALWTLRDRFPAGSALAVALGTLLWGLLSLRGTAFFVNCLMWAVVATAIVALRSDRSRKAAASDPVGSV